MPNLEQRLIHLQTTLHDKDSLIKNLENDLNFKNSTVYSNYASSLKPVNQLEQAVELTQEVNKSFHDFVKLSDNNTKINPYENSYFNTVKGVK